MTWSDIAGGTAASVTLARVALLDSGLRLRVVLSNANGTTLSDVVTLGVHPSLQLLAGALGGPGYRDAKGSSARFDFPRGSAVDAAGNVFVADTSNQVIRRIAPSGEVTTVAGTPGVSGRTDGPATSARLYYPRSVAFDATGALWFVDQGSCYLRKISSGVVTSIANLAIGSAGCHYGRSDSRTNDPAELAVGPTGEVFVSDRQQGLILKVDSAGAVSVFAGVPGSVGHGDGPRLGALFRAPRGLAFDKAGNLYVAEASNQTIRRIDSAGMVTTIAGSPGEYGFVDGIGSAARLTSPVGLALLGTQTLVITEIASHTVRLLDLPSQAVTTIAGDPGQAGTSDGSGTAAHFDSPYGVSTHDGTIYVSDSINAMIRRVTPAGVVTTLAGQALPAGTTDGVREAARLPGSGALAADAAGNVYLSDPVHHVIRKITPAGVVTTIAGSVDQLGYVDGIGSAARFNGPNGLVVDAQGNVIVGDTGNHAIRRISPSGAVTTIAGGGPRGYVNGTGIEARFDGPYGVALDSAGNIYVTDESNCVIRKISSGAVVTTLAGSGPMNCATIDGSGASAAMLWPQMLVATAVDEVVFLEVSSTQLRLARGDRSVSTVAGQAGRQGTTDGKGDTALFSNISGLARDGRGNIHVADGGNGAIRMIDPGFNVTTLIPGPGLNTALGSPSSIRYPTGIALLPGGGIAILTEAAIVID